MEPFEVIFFILGFGSILFLTYVTTRYIAAKSGRVMKGKHLSVVETISLGTDKRIHLVKAGDKHILVATTSKSFEYLTELTIDAAEAANESPLQDTQNIFDFRALFEKYMNTYKRKKSVPFRQETEMPNNNGEGEKFRFNLEKLKHITRKINTQIEKDGDDVTDEK